MAISIKHPVPGDGGIDAADYHVEHLITGTPGMALGFDGSGNATEMSIPSIGVTGLATIPTRANLAALTPAANDVRLLTEGGRYGVFKYTLGNFTARVTADYAQGVFVATAADPTGATGVWVRQFDGRLIFDWFGAVPGDYATGIGADCYPAWLALNSYVKAVKRNVSVSAYFGGTEVLFPGAQYYFSDTLQLKHTFRLKGMGSGYAGGEATWLRFPADKAGVVCNRNNTLGDVEESPATTGADGSIIEGFLLQGGGGTPDILKSGIRMRSRMVVRDCVVRNFAGLGVCIIAAMGLAASNPFYGNANNWRLETVRVEGNKYGGVYVSGGDANAGLATVVDASRNGRFGIRDSAFLGNSWVGCHTDINGAYNVVPGGGLLETSLVTDGTHRYYLINDQDANAATTPPTTGTSNSVWAYSGLGGTHANIPLYGTPGVSYVSGGSYLHTGTANLGIFDGCYYETGQAPPQILGPAIVENGFMGSGLPNGAPHIQGSTTHGMRSQRAYTQAITYGDGSTAYHRLGGDMSGATLDLLAWNSSSATPFNPDAKGIIQQTKATGDLFFNLYNILNPIFIAGYSTARNYGGRPQAEARYMVELPKFAIGSGDSAIPVGKGSAAPTAGYHKVGEIWENDGTVTALTAVQRWRCTTAGTPGTWTAMGGKSAAQADAAAATAVAAVAAPTKAEYDALLADVAALRTTVNGLLGKMRTANLLS